MTTILGIDQSYTSSGAIVLDESGAIVSAVIIRSDPANDVYDRAVAISTAINAIIRTANPAVVALEGLAFGKFGNATRDLAGLQFVIITNIRRLFPDVQISIISPNSLKKFATTSGKAKKVDMHAALPEEIKQHFKQNKFLATKGLYDITDAYWIARYATKFSLTQTVVSDNSNSTS
jgi:Holliday junction resolvasome RuvABC endonuclease subunit